MIRAFQRGILSLLCWPNKENSTRAAIKALALFLKVATNYGVID